MSSRFIAVFLGIGLALTGAANAAEVESSVEFKGDAADVWAKIGGWCAIADWHPVVAKCEETKKGGKKHRILTTVDGAVIEETMLTSDATSYRYQIDESPLPVANYTATLAVEASGDTVNVSWTAKFDPKGAEEAEAVKVIQGIFDGGLEAIKKTSE
jgi:hypothetical protein